MGSEHGFDVKDCQVRSPRLLEHEMYVLYVLVFVWYTSPLLFLPISAYFSSLKNVCKKHFHITCFLLFRNKNKPVCFAKSAEWDIYKVDQ